MRRFKKPINLLLLCFIISIFFMSYAKNAHARDINRIQIQTETNKDVCDGCKSCVYGCCWDSFPVKCNELSANTSSTEKQKIERLRNAKLAEKQNEQLKKTGKSGSKTIGTIKAKEATCIVGFKSDPSTVTKETDGYVCKSLKPSCLKGFNVHFEKFDGSVFKYTCARPEG
jgi:hypothetical protein